MANLNILPWGEVRTKVFCTIAAAKEPESFVRTLFDIFFDWMFQ